MIFSIPGNYLQSFDQKHVLIIENNLQYVFEQYLKIEVRKRVVKRFEIYPLVGYYKFSFNFVWIFFFLIKRVPFGCVNGTAPKITRQILRWV